MSRERLKDRRDCFTFRLRFNNIDYTLGFGVFDDGPAARVSEVFVTGPKAGTDIQALSRDGAILLSIALQYGAPLDVVKHAVSRNEDEAPSSLIGQLIDAVTAESGLINRLRGGGDDGPASASAEPRPLNGSGGEAAAPVPAE